MILGIVDVECRFVGLQNSFCGLSWQQSDQQCYLSFGLWRPGKYADSISGGVGWRRELEP